MIKELEIYLENLLKKLGYRENVTILPSNRKELGDFQINVCMNIAKKYHKNPMEIANSIVNQLDNRLENVNIAKPGFINFTISTETLLNYLNQSFNNFDLFIPNVPSLKVVLDFGGANAAKALHVGHMRSANIGEAIRRLLIKLGYTVISDVHLGDLGRQAGMLLSEIKERGEYLEYFNSNFKGEYRKVDYTPKELGEYYVSANIKALENEDKMNEVRQITANIDKGNKVYLNLWKQLVNISVITIKDIYNRLNCHFDLFEGELDSFQYIEPMLNKINKYLYESNGAMVIDVKQETDTKEIPPLIVIKKDLATIYATRDLATIYSRWERFNPDMIIYVVDSRQSLYFEQIFRASYKTNLVDKNCKLYHLGFGTINGSDMKPFKTRDGKVMELSNLLDLINNQIDSKMKSDIIENREQIREKLTISALKFADLMLNPATDYIFDLNKFSSFDGKTGPYILYTVVRLKSILEKANIKDYKILTINNIEMKDILLKITELPNIFIKSLNEMSLNLITNFLFEICGLFNKFYNTYHILTETDLTIKNSYLSMVKLVYDVIHELLNILAIDEVDKM